MAAGIRRLIVNADDLGFSAGTSRGILRAHREGIATSASLLTNMPDATHLVPTLAGVPDLGVGVHLNACQGRPLSAPGRQHLAGPDGVMDRTAAAVALACLRDRAVLDAIAAEFGMQIEWALDHHLRLTHLDSHRHLHAWPTIFARVIALARRYGIRHVRNLQEHWPRGGAGRPLGPNASTRRVLNILARFRRGQGDDVTTTTGTWGIEQTGAVDTAWLERMIAIVPVGVTEIMVHPGDDLDVSPDSTRLGPSRRIELEALCSPRVRETIVRHGIELTHYGRI